MHNDLRVSVRRRPRPIGVGETRAKPHANPRETGREVARRSTLIEEKPKYIRFRLAFSNIRARLHYSKSYCRQYGRASDNGERAMDGIKLLLQFLIYALCSSLGAALLVAAGERGLI